MAELVPTPGAKSASRSEKREKARKSAIEVALVTVDMEPAGFGLMLDVSEGGLGVQVMNRMVPGTDVQIAFGLPEVSSHIKGSGVIAWCDSDGRAGIRLQQLEDQSRQELQKWINSLPESAVHEPQAVAPKRMRPVRTDQVSAIQEQITASMLDIDTLLQSLVERAVELTLSNGAAIALGTIDVMVCRASTGLAPDVGVTIGSSSALTTECLRTGKIVRCEDTETDFRVDDAICKDLSLRSSVILPLLWNGQVRGVFEVFSPKPYAFNDRHIDLLQQLAEFTSQIVFGSVPASAADIEFLPKPQVQPEIVERSAPPEATPLAKAMAISASVEQPTSPQKISAQASPTIQRVVEPDLVAAPESLFDLGEQPRRSPAPFAVYIVLGVFLLAMAGLGWWYKSGNTGKPTQPSAASSTSAIQQPTPSAPITSQTSTASSTSPTPTDDAIKPAITPQPLQTKPIRQQIVAADTIRGPRAAIVKVDPSTPLMIASGSKPLPKPDTSTTEVPSVNVTAGTNLAGINLPGASRRPELQAQGVVTGGQLLRRVEPDYPMFAKQQHIQGNIVLSARVMKDGSVESIRRLSGNPVLGPAAVAAVRQWKYEPYELNGQPQDVDVSITVQFRLK